MDWTAEIRQLEDRTRATAAGRFPVDDPHLAVCGLYAWWADEDARTIISTALGADVGSLIYVGKAGGGASAQTLNSRIRGKHLGGTMRTSTFRHSITALLMSDPDFAAGHTDPWSPATRADVTAWMGAHLSVGTVTIPVPEAVEEAEQAALRLLDPPLNLSHVPRTAPRARLRALRAHLPRERQATRTP